MDYLKVLKQSARTWGVYRGKTLVEGGFFSRAAANERLISRANEELIASRADHAVSRREGEVM